MHRNSLPISLVIPIRNESETLDYLFDSLNKLFVIPGEIIFVDTGSTDGSVNKIKQWINQTEIVVNLIQKSGAYPGAARNAGVDHAKEEWIAFLDAGIIPKPDWLNALWLCRIENNSMLVYGCCRFSSQTFIGQMLCAISYGTKKLIPVLPASLFHRGLFQRFGMFQEFLRAGEDIKWKNTLQNEGIDLLVSQKAIVEYRYFSNSILQAIHKQFIYEQSLTVGIPRNINRTIVLSIYLALYPALFISPRFFYPILILYFLLRGFLDPIRRSGKWWSSSLQLLALPIVAACIDLAAAFGRILAMLGFSKYHLQEPPKLD